MQEDYTDDIFFSFIPLKSIDTSFFAITFAPSMEKDMKADKLTPKALLLLANMRGISRPVSSRDLGFLAPSVTGSREWALSTLRRMAEMQLLEQGPRVEGGMTFSLTEDGHAALLKQIPDFQVAPRTVLYQYDGPILFVSDVLGATRLIMADDMEGRCYYASTPDQTTIDRVLSNEVKVVEAMVCEPCLKVERSIKDGYKLSSEIQNSKTMREYCGESALLNPFATQVEPDL